MIKLDEKDLELINEFIKFIGSEETQDNEYPYAIEGLELFKSIKDKMKEFKEMFSVYAIASCEKDNPVIYAEFNNNDVYLELKEGYVFKNNNNYYMNLAIEKVDDNNESKSN